MSDDLRKSLEQIRVQSLELNKAADAAAAVVARVEKFLRDECHCGIWATVDECPTATQLKGAAAGQADRGLYALIGYDRVEGQFRIVAGLRRPDEAAAPKPWVNCDRQTKLQSFRLLPALVRTLAKSHEGPMQGVTAQDINTIAKQLGGALDQRTAG